MFADRPLVILAAGNEPPPPGMTPEMWAQYRTERLAQLKDLTTLSSHSRFVLDPTSGHDIPKDDPQLIAACIVHVVNAATDTRALDVAESCLAPGGSP